MPEHNQFVVGLAILSIHNHVILTIGFEDHLNFLKRIEKRLDHGELPEIIYFTERDVAFIQIQVSDLIIGFLTQNHPKKVIKIALHKFVELIEFFCGHPTNDHFIISKKKLVHDLFAYFSTRPTTHIRDASYSDLIRELRLRDVSMYVPARDRLEIQVIEKLSRSNDTIQIDGEIVVCNPLTSSLVLECSPSMEIGLSAKTPLELGKYTLLRYAIPDAHPYTIQLESDSMTLVWSALSEDIKVDGFTIEFSVDGVPRLETAPSNLSHRASFASSSVTWRFSHLVPSTIYKLSFPGSTINGLISMKGRFEGSLVSGLRLNDLCVYQATTDIDARHQMDLSFTTLLN